MMANRFKGNKLVLKQFKDVFFNSILQEPPNKEKLTKQFKRETIVNNNESPLQFPDFAPELKTWYDSILL